MKNKIFNFLFTLFILSTFSFCSPSSAEYIKNRGRIHGTYYLVTYQQPQGEDLQNKIESRMREFEQSLSTFEPNSVISRINKNDASVLTDHYFETMYKMAQQVSEKTDGAFDITVAPLVNAWGFGFGNRSRKDTPDVEAMLQYTGYEKIRLENHRLIKDDSRIMLDASAIAKGYSSDIVAQLLEENGCKNYMVEIGGEVRCKGVNPKGEKWKIGINKPVDDATNTQSEIEAVVAISNVGLATSGNYRQFYYRGDKKYSHTIDPRTGYPVNHSLLSATVIAPTCMQADAYATAFMVLGKDKALEVCGSVPDMECFLIYADDKGNNQIVYTKGFEKYLLKIK
ncbi:FAD:protein FMN transferase [Paludibacter sp. 221]|uniref:FAD:protein FMN transferase n=1 Tax=Paludibacter sp. 221 TaxID=2302939 RepID=UPI0013D7EAB5|nr:FAD:protein FMN transferase [Paludibacter sp. 221]NDV47830.1 FAD:protein FMN transferase [Paludibacter sp. 221]